MALRPEQVIGPAYDPLAYDPIPNRDVFATNDPEAALASPNPPSAPGPKKEMTDVGRVEARLQKQNEKRRKRLQKQVRRLRDGFRWRGRKSARQERAHKMADYLRLARFALAASPDTSKRNERRQRRTDVLHHIAEARTRR